MTKLQMSAWRWSFLTNASLLALILSVMYALTVSKSA